MDLDKIELIVGNIFWVVLSFVLFKHMLVGIYCNLLGYKKNKFYRRVYNSWNEKTPHYEDYKEKWVY